MEYINYVKQAPVQGVTGLWGGTQGALTSGASGPSSLDNEGYYVQFNGVPADQYLDIGQNSNFNLGTSNFTVEAFWRAEQDATVGDYHCIVSFGWPLQLYWQNDQFKFWASSTGSSGTYFVEGSSFNTGSHSANRGAWYHIAVTRESNTFRMFLNGELMDSVVDSGSIANPAHDTSIGRFGPNDNLKADGRVSNLRYIKGTALYTADFTAPVDNLTNVTNTELLCCNQSTATGATVTPVALSANNSPSVGSDAPLGKYLGYYAVSFDGSDDLLTFASTSDFHFGTSNFTLECWVKRTTDNKPYSRIMHFGPYWSNNDSIGLLFDDGDHTDKITFASYRNRNQGDVPSNGRILVSSSSVSLNTWYHVAVTRQSGTFRLFIDGTLEDTDASITSRDMEDSSSNTLAIAGTVDRMVEEAFGGIISNVRIIPGESLYNSSFTPSTKPLQVGSQGSTVSQTFIKALCCNQPTTTGCFVSPNMASITAGGSPSMSTDIPFSAP